MNRKPFASTIVLAFALSFGGFVRAGEATADGAAETPIDTPLEVHVAIARLEPAQGSRVRGSVHFVTQRDGVRVIAKVAGLAPGVHGFHIHEHGDLSAPDLSSAGGHYNPEGKPHGGPKSEARHVGDLGNLVANHSGVAQLDYVDPQLSLTGEHSIVGRSVIVHEAPDDLRSQPAGNAGPRIAGGVIELLR